MYRGTINVIILPTKEIMNTYTFDDILIQPAYSEIRSRKSVNTAVRVGNLSHDLPIISANMKTITGPRMAIEMGQCGAWGILHRFGDIEDAVADYNIAKNHLPGVSVGVNGESRERFQALYDAGARQFCIDVAHGHHILVREMIEYIKGEHSDVYVIAGNVATRDAYDALASWGADCVKIGIGPGSMCQTRTNTGVGVPQLGALEEISYRKRDKIQGPLIIADGGIKTIGDMAKALKFADLIMLGSFFAGSMETPGNVYKRKDGSRYKVYGGSAAGQNKLALGKRPEFVEGVTEEVNLGDHVKFLLREIKEGIQSACSYVGAENLEDFKKLCEFIHISGSGKEESKF